jgi:uncharacterized radical SAM superfamily Fe-S cluster-containing enzyme
VHFQPVSYFGKYPKTPENQDRITLPEVMEQIELQTNGKIKAENFGPLLSGNTFCSFKGSFNLQDDGSIKPLSSGGSCCDIEKESIMKARDFVLNKWVFKGKIVRRAKTESFDFSDMDEYIQRLQNYSFTVTGMAFQDAWNLDLERLARCTIHIFDAAKKELVPFCAYNLTDIDGNAIYRR